MKYKERLKVLYCDLHTVHGHLNKLITEKNDADTTIVPVAKAEIGMLMGMVGQIVNDLDLLNEELTKNVVFKSPESSL